MIVLQTERLMLRRFTPADAEVLSEVLCDRENMRFYPDPFTLEDCIDWISKNLHRYREDGVGLWAVIRKTDHQFLGDCGLLLQFAGGTAEMEVAYHFARRFQGQGYATEAARRCMQYAFRELMRERVISLIRPENLPSRRVAERNGMQVEQEIKWAGLPHLMYTANTAEVG